MRYLYYYGKDDGKIPKEQVKKFILTVTEGDTLSIKPEYNLKLRHIRTCKGLSQYEVQTFKKVKKVVKDGLDLDVMIF